MPRRSRQILLLFSTLWLSWLGMMFMHESGHVIGALLTDGQVQRVVWHPAAISRTEVRPNPHPLVEVWAGPVTACVVPLMFAAIASTTGVGSLYLICAWAGICLIANGAYIGIGAIHPVGDATELIKFGTPRSMLALFGIVTVAGGFWIWDRASPKLGFGKRPQPIRETHAWMTFALAVVATVLGVVFGDRGM